MSRVCNRAGCGQPLLNSDGSPSFRKHFCSRPCLNADNLGKKQLQRAKQPGKRCPRCGQAVVRNAVVCADKPPGEAQASV